MRRRQAMLQERETKLKDEYLALGNKIENEDRTRSAEERAEMDRLSAELQEVRGEIKAEDDFLEFEAAKPSPEKPIESRTSVGKPRHADDPMHGFKNRAEFCTAVMQAGRSNGLREDERLIPLRATVGSDEQSGIADEYGGYAVPTSMAGQFLTVGPEIDPTMGRMMEIPMQTPIVEVLARTDKNHTSSVTGGITVTRRPETVAGTASRMEVEKVALRATTQMAITYSTRELLSDSPLSFAALVDRSQREELGSQMLQEKLNGTGVGEPEGILTSPALISITRAGAGNNIDGDDLIGMRARAWRYARCIWMANHDCLPNLAEAHLAGSNSDVFLFQPARGEDTPDMLLGRPIFFSEYLPSVAAAGSLILADWGEYLLGEYQPVQGESSIHVRFLNHEETFKVWRRNDGRGWWRAALTPNQSSTTLSPFVTLAAA